MKWARTKIEFIEMGEDEDRKERFFIEVKNSNEKYNSRNFRQGTTVLWRKKTQLSFEQT